MAKITDINISQNSVVSLHTQLRNQLRQLILSGRWTPGSRIPSESEFSTHLRISRGTVRLALQQIEIEGLIERIAGRGSFVTDRSENGARSRLIAFVTCGLDSEAHLVLLSGAESQAKASGYRVIFSNARSNGEEIELLYQLRADRVAGVLLWPSPNFSRTPQENRKIYGELGLPMVLMDRTISGIECDVVTSDNYGGAVAIMHHLIERGHRRIVFLSHQQLQLVTIQERLRAYGDVLRENSITPSRPWVIGEEGQEIILSHVLYACRDENSLEMQQFKRQWIEAPEPPTAIFAVNDYLAVMALRALKFLNLKVPDDVSVVGFDDIDLAVHLEVPLTTVAQDYFAMGKRAAQVLLDRLEGDSEPTQIVNLPTQLRVRGSTSVPLKV